MSKLHEPPPRLESADPVRPYRTPGAERLPHLTNGEWLRLVEWMERHRDQLHNRRTVAFTVRLLSQSAEDFPRRPTSHCGGGFVPCTLPAKLIAPPIVREAARLANIQLKD